MNAAGHLKVTADLLDSADLTAAERLYATQTATDVIRFATRHLSDLPPGIRAKAVTFAFAVALALLDREECEANAPHD